MNQLVTPLRSGSMAGQKTVILANNRDYFSKIDGALTPHRRKELWQIDHDEAELALFWEGDGKMIVLPAPLDPLFVADVKHSMSYKDLSVISPNYNSGTLCEDLVRDRYALEQVADFLASGSQARLLSWGATDGLLDLVAELDHMKVVFDAPEISAQANARAAHFLGSKSGFRQLVGQMIVQGANLRLPEGYVCQDVQEASWLAERFLATGRGFVAKPDRSFGGWGVTTFTYESGRSVRPDEIVARLEEAVNEYGALCNSNLVVEELIVSPFGKTDRAIVPTVDATVDGAGQVSVRFAANMRIESLSHYNGAEVGKGILPLALEQEMRTTATLIGQELGRFGYVGWFDVDLVLDADYRLYCTEVNARRTSPIYAHDIYARLEFLHGPKVGSVVSNDSWQSAHLAGQSYASVREYLKPILFPIADDPRGMILTMSSPLAEGRGKVAYAVVGQDLGDALEIEEAAQRLIND